jgi:tetratricopeptide (TPR) repeat protein
MNRYPLLIAALLGAVTPLAAAAQQLPAPVAAAATPVRDGQALLKQGDFPAALAKFGAAEHAANAIPQPPLRLFYQVTSRLGSATALDAMQRDAEALVHADWANDTVGAPQSRLPTMLKGAVHHLRGVILFHQKRLDEARAMFDQAAAEGDQTAAAWRHAVDAAGAAERSAPSLVAAADAAVKNGRPSEALLLYVSALKRSDELGAATGSVMARTLVLALRRQPPPPAPIGAETRLAAADSALRNGAPGELAAARDMLRASLIVVPWWADGWRRLADVYEKLGDLAVARAALQFYLAAAPTAPDRAVAEQRIASLSQHIGSKPSSAAPPAAANPPAQFDGTWSMTQVCPPVGETLGYTTSLMVQVAGGAFHGEYGVQGQPGSLSLDGKIADDGTVSIKVSGLIGDDKSRTAGNAPPGSRYGYDVAGHVSASSGTGKRNSARHCDWTFVRQEAGGVGVADISGNWSTTDGRIISVKQNGNQVSWNSCCKKGHEGLVVTVSGTFDGKNLVGTYHYREGQAEGSGTVSYTLAGDRLEGVWKAPDGKTFDAALIRHRDTDLGDLTGRWTTVSGHTVTLTQSGNQVTWTTCCRQYHPNWSADISGTFDGRNFVGTYHWRDGGQQGNGTVSYALKGTQLEGTLERPGKEPYHSLLTRQLAANDLSGTWLLDDGRTIQIKQSGNQVGWDVRGGNGHESRVGTVTCTFDGKELVGMYQFTEGGVEGRGTIHMTLDGNRLEGTLASLNPPGQSRHTVITRQ